MQPDYLAMQVGHRLELLYSRLALFFELFDESADDTAIQKVRSSLVRGKFMA